MNFIPIKISFTWYVTRDKWTVKEILERSLVNKFKFYELYNFPSEPWLQSYVTFIQNRYNRRGQTSNKKCISLLRKGRGMLKKLGDKLDRIFVILHTSIIPSIGKPARFVRRLLLMLLSSLKCCLVVLVQVRGSWPKRNASVSGS